MVKFIRTYDSFIPSTIRQWNSLDPFLRNVDFIAKFKAELRKRKDISQVPKHYEIGPRKLNITPQLSHTSQAYSKIGLI
jgi:hypothetical protein